MSSPARPLDVTGYGGLPDTQTLALERVDRTTGVELQSDGDTISLVVDVSTTADVDVQVSGAVDRDELAKLREQIDAVLGE